MEWICLYFSFDYDAIAVDDIWDIHRYFMKKMGYYKIFGFIKKVFAVAITFLSCIVLNVNSFKFVSVNNQEYKVRTKIIMTVKSNEPSFYSYSIKANKNSGTCNNNNDPYEKLCIPVKKINV